MEPVRHGWMLVLLLITVVAGSAQEDAGYDFSFDLSELEVKPFEIGGLIELRPDVRWSNPDSIFRRLQTPGDQPHEITDQYGAVSQLEAKYSFRSAVLYGRYNLDLLLD